MFIPFVATESSVCPVHPKTKVKVICADGCVNSLAEAGEKIWTNKVMTGAVIIAYEIVQEYVEPVVFWVNNYPDMKLIDLIRTNTVYKTKDIAKMYASKTCIGQVKFIQVMDDGE